ncbi:MAG: response regulator transcription factor [Planctomycetes bacterium]|nr:response regulator transcription factor [Planctomycetota bacterium]
MARILIVEDDEALSAGLDYNLRRAGYDVDVVADGASAIQRARATPPDLMILDLMLPRRSGYDVLSVLRKSGARFPVLILSARDGELDKVKGFDLGADDYVTKPFALGELLARVRVRLQAHAADDGASGRLALESGVVDLKAHVLRTPAGDVSLTKTEVELLRMLGRRPGELVPREELVRVLWNLGPRSTRALDTHVLRLRKKIEPEPDQPRVLRTVHGVGYCLELRPERGP